MDAGRRGLHLRDDDELARLALTGVTDAWNEIARRHTRRVVVALLARGAPLDQAEDLAQETWLRLVRRQREGELQELQLPGLAIAQGVWLLRESWRSERRRAALRATAMAGGSPGVEPSDPAPGPEIVTMHRERLAALERELARCPERHREVFVRTYGPGGCGAEQVGRELGLSVQRVRQILTEVRARLRRSPEWSEETNHRAPSE